MNSLNSSASTHEPSALVKKSLWVSYLFLLGGLGLLIWLIYRLGPREILGYLQLLGIHFIFFMIPSFIGYLFINEAWNTFLRGIKLKVPFWRLFMIKITGEAVNSVTPFNWGGGDPVRIYLLKKSIPVAESTASVVIDRTLTSIALAIFMFVGILIAFFEFSLPPVLEIGFPLSLIFIMGMTFYFYKRQHEGIFEFLVKGLTRLRIKRHWSQETLGKLKEIDGQISRFYTHNRKGFFLAILYQLCSRLTGVVEIYLAAYFLHSPLTWVISYLLLSITAVVNMIFVLIPGSLGVLEGTYAGVFHLMGLDPAIGTSVQILRRIRMILWSAPGLYYLYHSNRHPVLLVEKSALHLD